MFTGSPGTGRLGADGEWTHDMFEEIEGDVKEEDNKPSSTSEK